MTSFPPAAAEIVPLSCAGIESVEVPEVYVVLMPCERLIPLPDSEYPDPSISIEPNCVPVGKLFTVARLDTPAGKSREAPLCGATSPDQFPAVIQSAFPPPRSMSTA